MAEPTGWTGRWCWSRRHDARPWNRYVWFRRAFDLSARPRNATVRISADSRYTLYVNGQYLHHGPARSYPQYQSFDTLDLAPLLRVGANVVAVVAHSFGVPTFQSVYRDAAGLLVDGKINLEQATISLDTPDGWLCRDARGWRQDVNRLSIQLGFQEHFDADADPPDWMSAAYVADQKDGWIEPENLGPVGTMPWFGMRERGIPLLAAHMERFEAVSAQFRGENARGYKVTDDVYRLATKEVRKKEKNLPRDAENLLRDDQTVTVIEAPEDGEFVVAVLDPRTYRSGHFILEIAEAAGDEVIDILYGEALDKTGMPVLRSSTSSLEATGDRYRCRPGAQRFETFEIRGLRYAALVFRNVRQALKVRFAGLRQVHAAVPDLGRFECSDEMLNRVWAIAKNTQLNCLFDAFVDCPWREQAQWWGDARVQGMVTAYAFGDASILARGIEQVAQSQNPDGTVMAHPPSDRNNRLPDFMLTWISSIWDHHQQTGDTALLRRMLPTMHRLLAFFAEHEKQDGLIGGFDGFWVFLDWAELRTTDFSGVLNAMYLQALRHAAELCRLGEDPAAEGYHAKAQALAQTIERLFWNAQEQAFSDGLDPATGERTDRISQQMNALAILTGLKPDAHGAIAREVLLKSARAKRGKVTTSSPFFYAYVLEALCAAGLATEAIEVIGEKWSPMVEAGATTFWEFFTDAGSLCHAWSASPLYHLSRLVLGVTPTAPRWDRVRIAPVPGALDFARGAVPSPHGAIGVEWERVGEDQLAVRIDLPEGVVAEFVDPSGNRRNLTAGSNEFNT